ncbi:VOC family protein [Chloroflexota bacterium]
MFEILDLNHINIVVSDVLVSKAFYCDILGMIDVPRHPNFTFPGAWLRSNSAEIHLVQEDYATHAPGDLSFQVAANSDKELSFSRHFSLVIDNNENLVAQLEKHEIPIAYGPVERLGGLIQTYCYDPDGHLIEFTQFP